MRSLLLIASLRIGTNVAVEHYDYDSTHQLSLSHSAASAHPPLVSVGAFKPRRANAQPTASVQHRQRHLQRQRPRRWQCLRLAVPRRRVVARAPNFAFKRARATGNSPSKAFTRAALSASPTESPRTRTESLSPREAFTTALPLGVSLSQTPHRAQCDSDWDAIS